MDNTWIFVLPNIVALAAVGGMIYSVYRCTSSKK